MKYPIGIQTFDKIIDGGYVYVDKTDLIYQLVQGNIYFLGRPRRFGKSLLVSTLEQYFRGNKELFKGLAIDKLETEWKQYPVFHIDFSTGNYLNDGVLEDVLSGNLTEWEAQYEVVRTSNDLGLRFQKVLRAAHEKTGLGAVVLIDEYDKPILDVIELSMPLLKGLTQTFALCSSLVLRNSRKSACSVDLTNLLTSA